MALIKSKVSLNGTYIKVFDSSNNELCTISFRPKKRVLVSQNMSKYQQKDKAWKKTLKNQKISL